MGEGPVHVITLQQADAVAGLRVLGTTKHALRQLERKGEFPPILRVSSRNHRVRVDELKEWVQARWSKPDPPTGVRVLLEPGETPELPPAFQRRRDRA